MARRPDTSDDPGFYVGYLPTPPAHALFLRRLAPALLAALAIAAISVAVAQRDPGAGVWRTGETTTVEGVLHAEPYPMIVSRGERVLLVESGKFGAAERATQFDGRTVRATGHSLVRDGRTMLELASGDGAIVDLGALPPVSPDRQSSPMQRTLIGEIVDSKCYHGAMKPGDGKTHKACAILCIQGGVPPVLVTTIDGRQEAVLLSTPNDGPVGDWILPFVGEPVEVEGEFLRTTAGPVLRVREGAATRR